MTKEKQFKGEDERPSPYIKQLTKNTCTVKEKLTDLTGTYIMLRGDTI